MRFRKLLRYVHRYEACLESIRPGVSAPALYWTPLVTLAHFSSFLINTYIIVSIITLVINLID